ncbi:MAG: hypothetical protein H7338_11965 [Candidatus Sericytochromatia bacterium]|nr:hypothetical protein [Candidatus Sericytochromatia bacterium]
MALVVLITAVSTGCGDGKIYYKEIGPIAWSEDGKFLFFVYKDRASEYVYKLSSEPGGRSPQRVFTSEKKILTLQVNFGSLLVSTAGVQEVDLASCEPKSIEIAGLVAEVAFYTEKKDLAFIANNSTSKRALYIKTASSAVIEIDPTEILSNTLGLTQISPDRRSLLYVTSKGWSIANLVPPYGSVRVNGASQGWWTSSQIISISENDCPARCEISTAGDIRPNGFPFPINRIQASPDNLRVAFSFSDPNHAWRHKVDSIAIAKPDGTGYRVVVDGNQLPDGPLVWEVVPS